MKIKKIPYTHKVAADNSFRGHVNFSNVLRAAFAPVDTEKAKRHCRLDCLFVLLGYAHVKAACKHVGEIDPRTHLLIVVFKNKSPQRKLLTLEI